VLFFSFQNLCIKLFNKKYLKKITCFFAFEFGLCLCASLIFIVFGANVLKLDKTSLILGILFGFSFILNVFFYIKIMEIAPLTISVLFNSFGMLIPTIAGIVFWEEKIHAIQLLGLVLMCICLILVAGVSKDDCGKINLKFITYGIATLIFCGLSGELQSAQQKLLNGSGIKEFSVVCYATAALAMLLGMAVVFKKTKQNFRDVLNIKPILIMIGAGVGTSLGSLTLMNSLCKLPAHLVYPIVNGGIIAILSILSRIVFKEKQSARGKVGITIGVLAIVLLSM